MARQRGVLEHVYAVLMESGGSVDITLLTEKLYERGCIDGQNQKHRHRLYTRIFMDISNKGEDSRFRKCGRGMFCLSQHLHKYSEEELGANSGVSAVGGDRRCGNCNYLEFSGIQIHQQLGGYCDNNERSNRHYVRCDENPCIHWRKRSTDKVMQDSQQRAETQQRIQIVNASVGARRR